MAKAAGLGTSTVQKLNNEMVRSKKPHSLLAVALDQSRAIGCISALRHYVFKLHAIGGLQKFEAIVEAFREMQPVGARGNN